MFSTFVSVFKPLKGAFLQYWRLCTKSQSECFCCFLAVAVVLGALSLSSQSEGLDSGGLEREREREDEWEAESVSPLFQFLPYFPSGAKMHTRKHGVKLLTQIFKRLFFSVAIQGMHL